MGMDVVIGIGKGYGMGMDDISVVGADQWYKRRKERKRLRYSYRCCRCMYKEDKGVLRMA